jgi:hypothetical protein
MYWIVLKEGYKPTMSTETEKEVTFIIQAKNRVTADRMVRQMLNFDNIEDYDCLASKEIINLCSNRLSERQR